MENKVNREREIAKEINTIELVFLPNGLGRLIDLKGNILFDNLSSDETLEIWRINRFLAEAFGYKLNRIK